MTMEQDFRNGEAYTGGWAVDATARFRATGADFHASQCNAIAQ